MFGQTQILTVVVSLYRAWVGAGAFDRIEREFDIMTRANLTGAEKRAVVIAAAQREFDALGEAAIKVAIELLWLQVQIRLGAPQR